jgi:hypothetical protein
MKECVLKLDPTQCIDAGLSCVAGAEEFPVIAQASALAQCANKLLSACDSNPSGSSATPRIANRATPQSVYTRGQSRNNQGEPASLALVEQRAQRLDARINATRGYITWSTGEGTGPSTNRVIVSVRDSGFPALSVTRLVTVIVREVNQAPSLAPIADYAVNEGDLLTFTSHATDPDLPPKSLRFTLRPGAPHGATVDSVTGVFRWQPTEIQGPSTNLMAIIVTDDGAPNLSATQEFSVVVRDVLSDLVLNLGSTNGLAGESNAVPVILASGLELSGLTARLE